jgi:hypothetical protein
LPAYIYNKEYVCERSALGEDCSAKVGQEKIWNLGKNKVYLRIIIFLKKKEQSIADCSCIQLVSVMLC